MKKPVRGKIEFEFAGEISINNEGQVIATVASDKGELTEIELSKNKSLKMLSDVPKRTDDPREMYGQLKRRLTVAGIIENYRSKAEELLAAGGLGKSREEMVAMLLRRLSYIEDCMKGSRTNDAVINAFWAGQLTRVIDLLELAKIGYFAQGGRRGGGARSKKNKYVLEVIRRAAAHQEARGFGSTPGVVAEYLRENPSQIIDDEQLGYKEIECIPDAAGDWYFEVHKDSLPSTAESKIIKSTGKEAETELVKRSVGRETDEKELIKFSAIKRYLQEIKGEVGQ